jgi:glycosyltransferase involved in cell wall biosynthesis
MSGLRVAMIGQRGVPATFGGVEHHVEEIGARLASRGHEVSVYCRTNYGCDHPSRYRGMHLRHLPTLPTKHFDAIAHSGVSTLAAIARRHDIIHYHALGPGLITFLPRMIGRARVVQTVHGLDDQRAKWGKGAQTVLRAAQWMSAHVPDTTIVVSRALAEHYAARHDRSTAYIPNGVAEPKPQPPAAIRARFGLERGGYVLFVGRLVPEKAPDLLVRAFRHLPGSTKLVIAGGSAYTDGYVADLHQLGAADPRVVFTDYVYGPLLAELYSNAAAFVLPSRLEGLPLTLLEAASYGIPVVASDIPPHVEVLEYEGAGRRMFPSGDELELAAALDRVLADPAGERAGAATLRDRVLQSYRWDQVTSDTESVYLRALGRTDEIVIDVAEQPRPHLTPAANGSVG